MQRLLISNSVIKMSPAVNSVLNYYLTHALFFTSLDFSLKNLTAEFSFFIGIVLLNTVFKNTGRSSFLKSNAFLYVTMNLSLIPLLYALKAHPQMPGLALILVYVGIHSLLFEIFSLPIVSIFLEICPENLEGFFMSLIFFLNNFSRNISNFLSTFLIYALSVGMGDLGSLSLMVGIHVAVCLVGAVLLAFSHIPAKKRRGAEGGGGVVDQIENNYLAYIDSKDSIVLDADLVSDPKSHEIVFGLQDRQAQVLNHVATDASIN